MPRSLAGAVQARAPEVHISTIYRNLEDLQQLGVIVHSHLGHGPATYQLASLAHGHFICEACGATLEAPDELFRGLAESVKAKLGFSIDPHHFAILGLCRACQDHPDQAPAGPRGAEAPLALTSAVERGTVSPLSAGPGPPTPPRRGQAARRDRRQRRR